MLKVTNLCASIDNTALLKNISLKVEAGETHCIMGPNGSGKSSLSKVLAGHPDYKVTAGEISYTAHFQTKNLLKMSPDERAKEGVFLALQHPVEIPGISNFEFLKESVKNQCSHLGTPLPTDDEIKERVRQLFSELKLPEDFLMRSVNDGFSGGEKKRSEVLQMLLLKPLLIFLDELDSGLDVDGLRTVTAALSRFMNEERALILVTHHHRIFDTIKPDFIHIILDGKIKKTGGLEIVKQIEEKGYDSFNHQ